MSVRRPLAALSAALLTCAGLAAGVGTASAAPSSPRADYIVTLADDAPQSAALQHARGLGGRIGHTYTHALNGFSVSLPERAAARLSDLPGVVDVEPVVTVQAKPQAAPAPPALWGLDRIDQRTLPLSAMPYAPAATGGSNVTAYVVDTGINAGHEDLRGRVLSGTDLVDALPADDCNGHGTHVAGTIGGTRHGVAPAVTLVPVRVLDCAGSGTNADVVKGLDWAAGHHVGGPAVANLSLGGGASTAVDAAVNGLIADGVTVVVAAGNGNQAGRPQNACNYSPARVPAALTVAATDSTDTVASFSNYGTCVDLYAPGVSITSTWYGNPTATRTISGTSMASPHVAGAAAVYLTAHAAASPADVAAAITGTATGATTADVVRGAPAGTPNLLLFAGADLVTAGSTATS
ncbi:S8 family peptidase [Blastococcus sp. SYSU D00813]